GGRTQVQAMRAAHPTFVTLWIGDNDVLGAVLTVNSGDSTLITPTASFQSDYRKVIDSIKAAGAKGLLIGVQNVTAIPYLSSGQTYFAIKNTPPSPFPTNFAVGQYCAPRALGGQGVSVLVPFRFGLACIGTAPLPPHPTSASRIRSTRRTTTGSERRILPLRPNANPEPCGRVETTASAHRWMPFR